MNFPDTFLNLTIPQYYAGKSVFLTGGTGFIGKVLIEKLLRGCPEIKNIYLMIRPKKGMSCEERLNKILKCPLFDKLNSINSDAINKVIPIPGDVVHKSLGISCEERKTLCENVEIIIHSAATVRFDEPIRVAMEMNVIGVIEMLKLAAEMKKLKVFCHISTAYSQCNLNKEDEIKEQFYPVFAEAEKIINVMQWMTDDMLNSLTKSLLGGYPNTYTFTKALAEDYLKRNAGNLPLIIVRPSIVTASLSDPVPGWVDNFFGISGVIAAVGKGVLRTIHAPKVKNDMVPVDLVSNCIISGVWYYGVSQLSQPLICNCTSGNVNPSYFVNMDKTCSEALYEYPFNSIVRRPNFAFAASKFMNRYWQVISHYIPAIIADGLSILVGSKPRFMNLYRSIDNNLSILEFFIFNEWKWGNQEYNRILKALPDEDRENFDFDMRRIDWEKYYQSITLGVKLYLIKDDLKELPKARRLHKRYKLVRWLSSLLITMLSCRFFFLKSERFRMLWFEALFAIYKFLQFFKIASFNA
ncbi:fatty acyl-CoA reductase 2 isoform X2 [Hydra vulgaris]|uniref:Fatty acyl-CoA reductase n=1 Tax=Hydra vulgaris TaxID=6087 RepID=A0ABM4BEC3_HYDVU